MVTQKVNFFLDILNFPIKIEPQFNMTKFYKIILTILTIALIVEGVFIFRQYKEIKKLTIDVSDISSRVDPQVDLSDIESKIEDFESRIDDLESENETLKRKVNTSNTNSDFDADYENRKLKRRIEELESKSNN